MSELVRLACKDRETRHEEGRNRGRRARLRDTRVGDKDHAFVP